MLIHFTFSIDQKATSTVEQYAKIMINNFLAAYIFHFQDKKTLLAWFQLTILPILFYNQRLF